MIIRFQGCANPFLIAMNKFVFTIIVLLVLRDFVAAEFLVFPEEFETAATLSRGDLYDHLNAHSYKSQSQVIKALEKHNIPYESFWIDNSIFIERCDKAMLNEILTINENISILPNQPIALHKSVQTKTMSFRPWDGSAVEWGVLKLNTAPVWRSGNRGSGVTVASIDSGVRYTHESLRRNYRGLREDGTVDHDFHFYDATSEREITPDIDGNGHGTHTMGSAVGANGIGVAPEAKWITVKAFDTMGSSSTVILKRSAQWVMCPKPAKGGRHDCSKGADVVLNSWDDPQGSTPWFKRILNAWLRARIVPVFAVGNTDAFHCGTVLSPADENHVISVGAILKSNIEWGASARGPSPQGGRIKPDVVAAGFAIRSANSASDRKYVRYTGTSMAAPHSKYSICLVCTT